MSHKESGKFEKLIVNRFGHFRAGWRITVYLIFSFFLFMVFGILLKIFLPENSSTEFGSIRENTANLIAIIALILSAFLILRFIDKRPFALLGINFSENWYKEFITGLFYGFVLVTLIFLILLFSGSAKLSFGNIGMFSAKTFLKYLLTFIIAGILEELMMRGYLLQALIEGSRDWIAIFTTSLLFSLAHLSNENWAWNGTLSAFLGGILLSIMYIKTRSLWMPIGFHIAWNWTQSSFWGMNVSGLKVTDTIFNTYLTSENLFNGGALGPESSLVAIVLLLISIFIIYGRDWIAPSEVNSSLWKKYPKGYNLKSVGKY